MPPHVYNIAYTALSVDLSPPDSKFLEAAANVLLTQPVGHRSVDLE